MTKKRRNKLMFRWSVFTAALITIFWTVWYFNTGSVPVVESIQWAENSYINLPVALSRWFDILLGPLYSISFISVLYWIKGTDNKDLVFVLVCSLAFALAISLIVVAASVPVFGLVIGVVSGLMCLLACGIVVGLIIGPVSVIFFGLVVGLASGLFFGIVVGTAAGIAVVLAIVLIFTLKLLFRWLVAENA